jgi:hypothetical protein
VRKQQTDRQNAQLILPLMLEDRFRQIWVPSWENRDLRQLLWHRHRMVQARTRIMNQLQAVALNGGLRCKKRLKLRCAATRNGVTSTSTWDAAGTENRQGRHGAATGVSHVLDLAQGMGARAVEKVRFARGTTRTSRWRAGELREIDWVSRREVMFQ